MHRRSRRAPVRCRPHLFLHGAVDTLVAAMRAETMNTMLGKPCYRSLSPCQRLRLREAEAIVERLSDRTERRDVVALLTERPR